MNKGVNSHNNNHLKKYHSIHFLNYKQSNFSSCSSRTISFRPCISFNFHQISPKICFTDPV